MHFTTVAELLSALAKHDGRYWTSEADPILDHAAVVNAIAHGYVECGLSGGGWNATAEIVLTPKGRKAAGLPPSMSPLQALIRRFRFG